MLLCRYVLGFGPLLQLAPLGTCLLGLGPVYETLVIYNFDTVIPCVQSGVTKKKTTATHKQQHKHKEDKDAKLSAESDLATWLQTLRILY